MPTEEIRLQYTLHYGYIKEVLRIRGGLLRLHDGCATVPPVAVGTYHGYCTVSVAYSSLFRDPNLATVNAEYATLMLRLCYSVDG